MVHFVGLDVSVKETSVCVVDDAGKVIFEQKVLTEAADIIALLNQQIDLYREQMRDYLVATGAPEGILIFVTTGQLVRVRPPFQLP